MKKVKEYRMLIVGIVVGLIVFGGGVYATTIGATNVSYSNASSGIYANNVQDAIDKLYEKAEKNTDYIKKLATSYAREVFVEVYPTPCNQMNKCTFNSLEIDSGMGQCMSNCVNTNGGTRDDCTIKCYGGMCNVDNLGKLDDGCSKKCSGDDFCYDTCFSATVDNSKCVDIYRFHNK